MTRLSISNIAWNHSSDDEVAKLLVRRGITAIDIAPSKYFDDYANVSNEDALKLRKWWENRGIEIVGFQSLFFDRPGWNLFDSDTVQAEMLIHLSGVSRLASILGAKRLVFGSPRNRDIKGLPISEADSVAIDFFRKLGRIGAENDIVFCLEPNPAEYGCNFMVNSSEAAHVVNEVGSPFVKLQFDLGACETNAENPIETALKYNSITEHVHLSVRNLLPLHETSFETRTIADALRNLHRISFFTIEQRPLGTSAKSEIETLELSLIFASQLLGKGGAR